MMKDMIFKVSVLGLLLIAPVAAQKKKEEKAPLRTFSLIPVGRISDTIWIGEGENTKAVAVDPGAVPPPTLFYKTPKGEFSTLRLLLNGNGSPAILNKPKLELFWRKPSGDGEKNPETFMNVNVPIKPGHYDVVLWRKDKNPDWKEAKRLVIPGSYAVFPKNSIRLLNINSKPIRVLFGEKVEDIPANAGRILKFNPTDIGKSARIKIAYADDEKWKFVLRTAIRIKQDQRINVIIYPSRIKQRLCEVARFIQPAPPVIKEKDGDVSIGQSE